jgi:hypothetical protein
MPDADRKVIDPISLAALILSIPSAVLAVMDIADRLTKHRKASGNPGPLLETCLSV